MKIKNTLSRNKIIPFADAFIEAPVKSEWLAINRMGVVYALESPPMIDDFGDVFTKDLTPIEISGEAIMVAHVISFGDSQSIKIEDLMAGI